MDLVQHPEHHFVFDHAKWIFYAATYYTWLGDDEPAEEHAREIIAYHTNPDGSLNAPMRTANAHIDLGLSWPRMASWTRRWTMACGHSSSSERPKRPSCHERPTSTTTSCGATPANASSSPSTSSTPTPGDAYEASVA